MLSSNCTHSLLQRPHLQPFSLARVSNRRSRIFRVPESHHRRSSKQGRSTIVFKTSCFRQEEFPSGTSKPEGVEEPDKREFSKLNADVPHWGSRFGQVADAAFNATRKSWKVPWTAETVLRVTILWISAFWFVGNWVVPFGAYLAGVNKESITYRGQALLSLLTDIMGGFAGVTVLHRCLSPFHPLPSDLFRFCLGGNWPLDVVIGCLMFPLVERLSKFNLDLALLLPSSTPITHPSVAESIMTKDPVVMAIYAILFVLCAPVWEEIVFRGFLLPSLSKYMPVWCSILVSSVAFALVHINVQQALPLMSLGMLMGIIYARSRNLLPSMLLHSLWNAFVFLGIMK